MEEQCCLTQLHRYSPFLSAKIDIHGITKSKRRGNRRATGMDKQHRNKPPTRTEERRCSTGLWPVQFGVSPDCLWRSCYRRPKSPHCQLETPNPKLETHFAPSRPLGPTRTLSDLEPWGDARVLPYPPLILLFFEITRSSSAPLSDSTVTHVSTRPTATCHHGLRVGAWTEKM